MVPVGDTWGAWPVIGTCTSVQDPAFQQRHGAASTQDIAMCSHQCPVFPVCYEAQIGPHPPHGQHHHAQSSWQG